MRQIPHRLQFAATLLALLAMVMVFVGPLISQLETDATSLTRASHYGTPADSRHGHMQGAAPCHAHANEQAVFTWHDQCGYCSLWQCFPVTGAAIPITKRDILKPAAAHFHPAPINRHSVPVFLNALSRAPPIFSALPTPVL